MEGNGNRQKIKMEMGNWRRHYEEIKAMSLRRSVVAGAVPNGIIARREMNLREMRIISKRRRKASYRIIKACSYYVARSAKMECSAAHNQERKSSATQ